MREGGREREREERGRESQNLVSLINTLPIALKYIHIKIPSPLRSFRKGSRQRNSRHSYINRKEDFGRYKMRIILNSGVAF